MKREIPQSPSIIVTDKPCSGAIVALFTGGGFFGAFFAGPLGDWLGRRLAIMIGAIIFCLGGGLQTGAQDVSYLYAGRVVAGLGVGILVMIVPLYQAEIAHPAIRGRITGLQQFMLGIGAAVASKLLPISLFGVSNILQHGLFTAQTFT